MSGKGAALLLLFLALGSARGASLAAETSDQQAARGSLLYRAHCQACHGRNAQEPVAGAKNLREFKGEESAFAQVVTTGRNAMPAHPYLSAADIAAIYAYVKGE